MAKEICISSTPHETRLAILEDDQLAEIYYERENEYTLAGSVYNGRVTRVLPGMQSAFVDVGLERDAFLYVTDFLELEDQEETDELERAAANGGNQPPREIRHSPAPDSSGGRSETRFPRSGQKADQGSEQKQEPRPERPARSRRLSVEAIPEAGDAAVAAPESSFISGPSSSAEDDSTEPGAKRWRGRRRRRGGRGLAGPPEGKAESEESTEIYPQTPAETEVAPVINAEAGVPSDRSSSLGWSAGVPSDAPPRRGAASAPPAGHAPAPFVLPGESLSKYGSAAADDAPQSPPTAPARPASTSRPSTLIEAPLQWDGSGLLPGESLSKHRARRSEPAVEFESANAVQDNGAAPDEIEEEGLVSERIEPSPASAAKPEAEATPEGLVPEAAEERLAREESIEDVQFEESTESAPESPAAKAKVYEVEPVIEEPSADEQLADPVIRQDETPAGLSSDKPAATDPAGTETEPPDTGVPDDASAAHRVDPMPPAGFKLPFGLGGKKKKEEAPAKPASAAPVSDFAPGSGLLEEEVIEGEEFDAPRHPHRHGKAEDHDLDDFEEETLPNQLRTGDLGEMLQEAHLDHRIQLNFDGKTGEDEDGFDEDEDETAAEGQPAAGEGQVQQRRDRTGRARRGRGAPGGPGKGRISSRRSAQMSDLPIISDLLKPGQEILVQIAKEPIAKKGARITSHIALPGRFLVFMPTVSHIGVSRKIASDEERQRLKRILVHERGETSGGFIVRTAAEGASEEELRADLRMLINLWNEIKQRSESSKSPALIYHDLSLIERILRDQVSSNFSHIWVDSEADYERIVRFLNRFSPTLVRRVKLYTKETPLFEHFGIQDEISKALRSKVWLKSGGSIVINQTEALVAIDINTGKYVGKSARLEDTIVKTNLDAVPEIVRQIRLRDLGGIIVIDFIDMDDRKNRFKVLAALEEALKSDRAPTKVLQFNDFGLVAITRKRVKQSLERTLSVPCPTCQATGMVKSPTTVCNEIYTELRKMRKHFEGADVLLRVNPETVKVLKSNNASWLTEFEELIGKNILIKSDPTLHPEQFDIQG
ncbi:MAG TPA: Rne/Rng family ribonuclease [Terracidiphilus sp.]|nr:Rne/Rng family ribonuclease [Terracidiphilus sp.]